MNTPLLIGQLCAFGDDGHNLYRIHGPGLALSQCDGVEVVECEVNHRLTPWLIDHADVLILHVINAEIFPYVDARKRRGQITLFEACDNYLDLQPWNPYAENWMDRSLVDQFMLLLSQVDLVQTSTHQLAELWRERARRVEVFPNHLHQIDPLPPIPNGPLTIGWAGSLTHLPDLMQLATWLEPWLHKNRSVRLALMTDPLGPTFFSLPADRLIYQPPGSLQDYLRFVKQLHVGLVPILPTPFNKGRTDLKYLEYAICGVPGLYAAEGPYPEAIRSGENGFLYRNRAEFEEQLDRLVQDAALRQQIRQKAYHEVSQTRRIEKNIQQRLGVYRREVPKPKKKIIPKEVQAFQIAPRYYHCRKGRPEEIVHAASKSPANPTLVMELEKVVAEFPHYTVAIRLLARMLIELQEAPRAHPLIERGLALEPNSPGLLMIQIHQHLQNGETNAAQRCLETVLSTNPTFTGAWPLLNRVLESKDPTIKKVWAERILQANHYNYLAALGIIKLLPRGEWYDHLLQQLERFADQFHPEERPSAAAAYGHLIVQFNEMVTPEQELHLLERAVQVFPMSIRLLNRYAEILWKHQRYEESLIAYQKSHEMARIAQLAELEKPSWKLSERIWQIAETTRRHQ